MREGKSGVYGHLFLWDGQIVKGVSFQEYMLNVTKKDIHHKIIKNGGFYERIKRNGVVRIQL